MEFLSRFKVQLVIAAIIFTGVSLGAIGLNAVESIASFELSNSLFGIVPLGVYALFTWFVYALGKDGSAGVPGAIIGIAWFLLTVGVVGGVVVKVLFSVFA